MYWGKDIKGAPGARKGGEAFRTARLRARSFSWCAACLLVCLALPPIALAHGSVTAEENLCLIRIGYLSAHFKIYLPQRWGHQDFCEDLPAAGEAVFVMEYIHQDLGRLPLDFRIIRDVTGLGRFARVEDVAAIADIEAATVLHQRADAVPDVFTALHHFDEEGDYLGIVTVTRPDIGQVYTAVFPFEVGFTGFGGWPLLLVLALLIQFNYWFMTGRFRRHPTQAPRRHA